MLLSKAILQIFEKPLSFINIMPFFADFFCENQGLILQTLLSVMVTLS